MTAGHGLAATEDIPTLAPPQIDYRFHEVVIAVHFGEIFTAMAARFLNRPFSASLAENARHANWLTSHLCGAACI